MNLKEIKKLVDGSPDEMIKTMAKHGNDFSGSGIGKGMLDTMIAEYFPVPEEAIDSVDFLFWFSYFLEKETEELIKTTEVKLGCREDFISIVFEGMHFGEKIRILKKLYPRKNDPLIKLIRKVQDLRNNISHGRFNKLIYGGYYFSDERARIKIIGDLRDAFLNKNNSKK